jgi:NAD(P)-dependent dehydrogenase (short-subunit alcohol dehydrogenase family)
MTRTAVITGTASGMGRATVERFLGEGWSVVATVRRAEDLRLWAGRDRVATLLLDVDDETAAEPFAARAAAAFGRIDVLVNNAGYYQMGPLEASSMDQIHRQFQTNVFGLIAITRAVLPTMRAQGSGVIINIASIGADGGYPYTSVYSASKAAVATLTEGLNIELVPFGVQAKAILPGQHATGIFNKIDGPDLDLPEYAAGIKAFFDGVPTAGSAPSAAADVIYEAATDGKRRKVHYYAGPDALTIPRAKRILGPEGYWEEFQAFVEGQPSPLWNTLMVAPGTGNGGVGFDRNV